MNLAMKQAGRTLSEEGVVSLSRKAIRLARTKKVRLSDDRYWEWRGGTQELTVEGTTARFEATSNAGGGTIRWLNLNERSVIQDILQELGPSDVFFDIGANIGFFSCFAANQLTDGLVVAFEPHSPNAKQLRSNLSYNCSGNAVVHELALSDSDGQMSFTDPDGLSQTASFEPKNSTSTVEQVRGDALVGVSVPSPTVVKIDVEGAEPAVIQGMKQTLSSDKCRALFCEVHLPQEDRRPSIKDYGCDLDDVLETVEGLGFTVDSKERRGEEIHLKAKK